MTTKAFVSYSHRDERFLERLKTHLVMLERDGLIETWTDREIHAGDKIDATIMEAADSSLIFLPIVSPDFLNSDYCYEREMQYALDRASRGEMLIVPIIAEPCEWKASPLNEFKVLPKDGKAISEWANANNAFLDIATELRRLLTKSTASSPRNVTSESPGRRPPPQVRVRRDFSSIDRGKFRDAAYQEIRRYFEASIDEFSQIDGLQGAFEDIDANAFTCTIVNGSKREAESHLTVRNNKRGQSSLGDITCDHSAFAPENSANEVINVDADDYEMFLSMGFGGRFMRDDSEHHLSAQQVAEAIWKDFVRRAGVDYE